MGLKDKKLQKFYEPVLCPKVVYGYNNNAVKD
jgi:hypothetical protein